MSINYSAPTTIKKTRATPRQWLCFFTFSKGEVLFIGRNSYVKTGFFTARRTSNGQRVNVCPLTKLRSNRPLVAKKA